MSVDLQKLTVPQLRALCKEKGLTGYSKVPKPVLIEKLAAATATVFPAPSVTTTRLEEPPCTKNALPKQKKLKDTRATVQVSTQAVTAKNLSLDHQIDVNLSASVNGKKKATGVEENLPDVTASTEVPKEAPTLAVPYQQGTSPDIPIDVTQSPRTPQNAGPVSSLSRDTAGKPLLRITRPGITGEPPLKRLKLSDDLNEKKGSPQMTGSQLQDSVTMQGHMSLVVQSVDKDNSQAAIKRIPRATAITGKRYIPLIVKLKDASASDLMQKTRQAELAKSHHPTTHVSYSASAAIDFNDGLFSVPIGGVEAELSFKAITFPPPLSQRKFATKLAIILRDINTADMSSLTLTSRLFRYSAYLSAASHLKRWYAGERLDTVLSVKGVSCDRMSLWEYRKLREKEVEERKDILSRRMGMSGSAQILGRLICWDVGVIEDSVWRGDDVKGLIVALR